MYLDQQQVLDGEMVGNNVCSQSAAFNSYIFHARNIHVWEFGSANPPLKLKIFFRLSKGRSLKTGEHIRMTVRM